MRQHSRDLRASVPPSSIDSATLAFVRPLRLAVAALFLAAPFACASRGPDLVARMTSASSIYQSVGFTPQGAPATGSVAEGKETKVTLSFKEGCYIVAAFPGDGLKGIELALLDPAGKPVGQASKHEGQTSIKACVPEAASYTLVVKSAGGSGSFLAQSYASSEKAPAKTGPDETEPNAGCMGDDCDDPGGGGGGGGGGDPCTNPGELAVGGTVKSTTKGKQIVPHSGCSVADGPSVVQRLHVEGRHRLVLDLNAKFDAVMTLYRAAHDGYLCDNGYEVDCSDDSEGLTTKGHIEAVVDTGDYGVVVTGYDNDAGEFDLRARLEDAPSLESVCTAAHPAAIGSKTTELVGSEGSNFSASCTTSSGSEALFKFELKAKSRVRLGMRASGGGDSSLSVRRRCEDPSTEVLCSKDWHFDGISWTGLLEPGAYTAIGDTTDASHAGTIDLSLDAAGALGDGTADGESCKDAKALPLGALFTVDTFKAKADVKASCAADSAADVVYKLDVKTKSRLFVSTTEDEARHVVAIQKTCGETKGEIACDQPTPSKGFDATLEPGSYSVVVKGKGGDDFGRTKLTARLRELDAAKTACKAAPKLVSGTPITDTTAAQTDKFASEKCGGPVATQASGDRVYQFTLKERSKVNLSLKSGTFYNAIMSLRTDCADPTRNELTCSTTYGKVLDRDLDKGTYYVVVDGYGGKAEGSYTIEMTTKPIK